MKESNGEKCGKLFVYRKERGCFVSRYWV